MTATPESLIEAVRYYSDLDLCEAKMSRMKWADGKPVCPKCGGKQVGRIAARRLYQCRDTECRKQFSVKVGTIFEDSPLGLDKWFVAVWCIANAKNGISSCELARALGVTQKSAWFMLHRIREAMQNRSFEKLAGEIEVDETYVGGEARNMHKHIRAKRITGRGSVGKKAVQGVLQRGGEVRTFVARDTEGETLRPNVSRNFEWGSKVFTDALPAYDGLSRQFAHYSVDHSVAFVRGIVHTNGLENFWSLFKRSLKGTWTHVATFHLDRYAREQAWRFNNRRMGDGARFDRVLGGVVGRRITYRQLCAIDDSGFMGKR
jgi:transposase-like protein